MTDGPGRTFEVRAGLIVSIGVALAVGACQGRCGGRPPSDPVTRSGPAITSIRISPASASVAVGQRLRLRVEARDADGNYVWIEDLPGAKVEWRGRAEYTPGASGSGFSFDPASGPETVVVVADATVASLEVEALLAWETFSESAISRLTVGLPALVADDRVIAIPTTDPVVAMLDGCEATSSTPSPVHAMLGEFAGTWLLTSNLTQSGCTRPTEFALFSKGRRMTFRDERSLQNPVPRTIWTNVPGDELRADTIAWDAPDQVDLYIYYFLPGETGVQAVAEKKVIEANEIFARNRLGIEFQWVHMTMSSTAHVGACPRSYVSSTMGVDLTEERLNVAFVKSTSPANVGISCPPSTAGEGRIIVIDWDLMSHETLAHEIGHALGHERKNLGFYHVKAGSTPGFARTNLMHERSTAGSREWLTIGQIFRMSVDTGSWYQHAQGILDRHPAKACGCEPYTEQVCPRLDRQPGVTPTPAPMNYCGPSS